MAELGAIISVHAQFPKSVVPNTDLDLNPTNWEWKQLLAFPVSQLNDLRFSSKPYKWIRYATGTVIGAHGQLSTECNLSNPLPIDYESGLSAISIDLYYHTTDQEKHQMFPLDPKLADRTTVTSSQMSTCRDDFWEDVEDRDGSCVATGAPRDFCNAAHLLPHSKGNTYIETFSTHRRRDSSGDNDTVRNINDVRNGLFLSANLHRALGKHFAFLKTPNFAMDTTDVDSTADRAQERFTSHLFIPDEPFVPSGSAVRIPSNMSIWPPTVLFDAVYASAVLHHFGFAPMHIYEKWRDVFYLGGPTKAADADDRPNTDKANIKVQYEARQLRRDRRGEMGDIHDGFGPHDMVMMIRFMAMEPEKVRAYLEGCEEMVAAGERKRLEESVNSWRESVDPSN